MNSLKGRIALVTGSSRGIGAAIARALSQVRSEIAGAGGRAIEVRADLTRFAENEAA